MNDVSVKKKKKIVFAPFNYSLTEMSGLASSLLCVHGACHKTYLPNLSTVYIHMMYIMDKSTILLF